MNVCTCLLPILAQNNSDFLSLPISQDILRLGRTTAYHRGSPY